MAYRRSLFIRGNLNRKCNPSFSYVIHSDERKHEHLGGKSSSVGISNFIQTRAFGSSLNGSVGFGTSSRDRMLSNRFLTPCSGYSFCRYMSTVNQGSDKIDIMTGLAEVLSDTTMEGVASQATIVNEVAIAAADSFLPVKFLQYAIGAVHCYTGLNWWAAIVLTSLVIRSATVPLSINQLKAISLFVLMALKMEAIRKRMQDQAMVPAAFSEVQKEFKKLFKEYGMSPFTPLIGLFIQGLIFVSFFLAINNMAEKVPSFKQGGAFWFMDLTTPDTLYILPVLTVLSFLISVEFKAQEGSEGNPLSGTMKNVTRGLAVLIVPITMGFPKAIFCHWVTSNLFSLVYRLVLKVPGVKKTLGFPEMTEAPPASAPQSPFSIFPALKKDVSVTNGSRSLPDEPSKHSDKKISSSVISQRLRSLEKQVKGRKKNNKK